MAAHTILLKGECIRKEAVAGGAITPGHLVQGMPGTTVVHATAGGNARKAFALENDLIGDGIDTAYGSGDTVQIGVPQKGAEVYAWLKNGENVVVGDALESAGDGSLQKFTPSIDTSTTSEDVPVDSIVAYAIEALNNTTGAKARLTVEVA